MSNRSNHVDVQVAAGKKVARDDGAYSTIAAGGETIRVHAADAAWMKGCGLVATTASITQSSLADGAVGVAYGPVTLTGTGGTGPYTFEVTDNDLPPGLALSAAGVLNGTPTAAGAYPFSVTVTDANGVQGVSDFTITVTE